MTDILWTRRHAKEWLELCPPSASRRYEPATVRWRSLRPVHPDKLERPLLERLRRASRQLHTPSCSSPEAPRLRASPPIGEFWSYPKSRAFAELLIDCEEERTLGTVLVMMLREAGLSLGHWAHRGAASQSEPGGLRESRTCQRLPSGLRLTAFSCEAVACAKTQASYEIGSP